jgi:choice-of-anchor B domain-containing protein
MDCRVARIGALLLCASVLGHARAAEPLPVEMQALLDARPATPKALAPKHATPCVGGFAGTYPCSNIDLLAFVPVADFAATSTNSLWGWTDSLTGIEYALVGVNNGTVFLDLSTPDHPRYLGKLPTHTGSSVWRDVRVYRDHAYVVSDNNGAHGMQVFDLRQLRGVTTPQTFAETVFYNNAAAGTPLGRGHTIAINEDTGYAYIAGSNLCPAPSATGALHMVDIRVPASPVFAGCIGTGGYTHETQCWLYAGPDTAHAGREICFNSNGNNERLAIVDVTDKAAPATLSSTPYTGSAFTHQGWLTPDHRYFLLNDELDESEQGHNARTLVWDVADLDAPVLVGYHQHALPVIDHNLYVHGEYVYESNYEAGLRILRLGNLSQAELTEVAYFDTYPAGNAASFNGTWNNYRFPASGVTIVTGIDEGLFVLQPNLCTPPAAPSGLGATANGDQRIDLAWTGSGAVGASYRVERAQGGCAGTFETVADGLTASTHSDIGVSGQVTFGYRVVERSASGQCASPASSCVQAQTSGACTAPPLFAGITQAGSAGSASCRIDLAWNAAAPACGGPARYSVYRDASAGFTPAAANRIAQDLSGTTFGDTNAPYATPQYYVVRAGDAANGSEESNRIELRASAYGPVADGPYASGAEPGEPPLDTEAPGAVPASGAAGKALAAPKHAGWHISPARFHGGARSFWSTSANNLCVSLVTPSLTLSAGQASQLSFWTAWDIEAGWDGGVIEISTDNGGSWSRLTPAGGYPATITNGGALCGIAQGSGVFGGTDQLTWTQRSVDLAAYAGQSVQLRWLYRTDSAVAEEGWFVDDVAITHALVPGPCTADAPLLSDGFE